MDIQITWSVLQMEAYPESAGFTDVVFNVGWAVNGSYDIYTGYAYGSTYVPAPSGADFTPYADLTEAQVLDWVKTALGKEQVVAIEASVVSQIEDQINPPVVTPPLPWSAK